MTLVKRGLITAWALCIVSILLLSTGLIGVDLRPALPVHLAMAQPAAPSADASTGPVNFMTILRIVLLLGVAILLAYIVASLFTPAGRRRLLVMAAVALVMLLALTLLSLVHTTRETDANAQPAMGAGQPPLPTTSPESTVPFEPRPPSWLLWTALAASSLIAAAGVVGVVLHVIRRRPKGARQRLAAQTRAAIDSIAAGADIRNVVVRCYREMSVVVRDELGIERETAITPREFARVLESWGLPGGPVRDLTEVFEEIRYGNTETAVTHEKRALDSLALIAGFCAATDRRGILAATDRRGIPAEPR